MNLLDIYQVIRIAAQQRSAPSLLPATHCASPPLDDLCSDLCSALRTPTRGFIPRDSRFSGLIFGIDSIIRYCRLTAHFSQRRRRRRRRKPRRRDPAEPFPAKTGLFLSRRAKIIKRNKDSLNTTSTSNTVDRRLNHVAVKNWLVLVQSVRAGLACSNTRRSLYVSLSPPSACTRRRG